MATAETEPKEDDEVEPHQVAPAEARRVTKTFTEMRAWQQEMKRDPENATNSFYGSKRQFMESCRNVYPIEVVDSNQAGTQITKSREKLEELDLIPNLTAELAKVARDIRLEQVKEPLKLIREIDKIVEPASRTLQKYVEENPGFDFESESQMDMCFHELYRLELLRNELENRLTPEEKKALAEGKEVAKKPTGGTEPAPGESEQEFQERINSELEANWDRLLKEQLHISVDEWFEDNMPGDPDWTMFGQDTEKWQRLHNGLAEIRNDYREDDRIKSDKDSEYKIKLNELLRTF